MFSSLRVKSYIFVAVFLVGLLIQLVVQFQHNERLKENAEYIAGTQSQILTNLHRLQVTRIQIHQWLTDISATRGLDGLDDGFYEAEKSANDFRALVSQLAVLDEAQADAYAGLIPLMDSYYAAGRKMAQAYIEGGAFAGNQLMGDFDATAEAIHEQLEQISLAINQRAQAALVAQSEATARAQTINVLFSAMYLILLLLGLLGLTRVVLNPVRALVNMTENLAQGEGDLTQRFTVNGKDEISVLSQNVNDFIVRADLMVSEMMKSIVRLVPMSNEIGQTNLEIQRTSISQQQQRQRLGEAMHQTQASSDAVLARSDEIGNSVSDGGKILDASRQVAQATHESIEQLNSEMSEMSHAVRGLRDNSDKIGSIIDVINGISEQTNLLALNAAIEAARAGEAGRGFSVVADEVRGLAGRTRAATIEVQQMISAIQEGTQRVESSIERGIARTNTSAEQVNLSSANLADIEQSIDKINGQTQEITYEIEVQNRHFSEVFRLVETMETEFKDVLRHLETNLYFGEDLAKLSNKLGGLGSRFNVSDASLSDKVRSPIRKTPGA